MKKDDAGRVNDRSASAGMWNVLAMVGGMIPGVPALSQGIARQSVQRLLGFWMLWHLSGGRQGLLSNGIMASSTVYRQENEFRAVFGEDVQDWGLALSEALRKAGSDDQQD